VSRGGSGGEGGGGSKEAGTASFHYRSKRILQNGISFLTAQMQNTAAAWALPPREAGVQFLSSRRTTRFPRMDTHRFPCMSRKTCSPTS